MVRIMLLEFSCSNHKSIRNKITLSLVAGSDTSHEENTKEFGDIRVLKSALIYGANGSGKSNLVDAISFVKRVVMNSVTYQPGTGIMQIPHKLEGTTLPSTYQIHFIAGSIRYVFGFSLKNMLVDEEYLYCFPNGRSTMIYERDTEGFTPGSKYKNKFGTCKDVLRPNRLLLSCAANFTSVEEIMDVYRFFAEDLVIYDSTNQDNWMNYSLCQINENSIMKETVLSFMRSLGMDIKDIKVNIDKKKMELSELPPFLNDDFKNMLLQKDIDAISARVVYDKFEIDLMQDESDGVRKLFGLLCPMIEIMINGRVLVCDELENNLHEAILYELVKLFMKLKFSKFPQIVFTTHETGLLNMELFRRDQIWFTELEGSERYTDLYSLSEIKNVRKDDNFSKGYISGKYGAIPMLNSEFADYISKKM